MSAPLPEKYNSEDIRRHIDTVAMRQQLLNQIIKDLKLTDFDIEVSASDFFFKIKEILVERLSYLIDFQSSSLAQIIYQVDLNEAKIKHALHTHQANSTQILADEILKREMQKVFYRNVYNGTIKL